MAVSSVLVLGGQGYIGSALSCYLRAIGLEVQTVDLGLRGISTKIANQCRSCQSLSAQEMSEFDAVVLLAGHSGVAACEHAPDEAFANNVSGFVDLVHRLRGQKLIFASSVGVYVSTSGRAVAEDTFLPEPVSYYDLHKQTIESYASLASANNTMCHRCKDASRDAA